MATMSFISTVHRRLTSRLVFAWLFLAVCAFYYLYPDYRPGALAAQGLFSDNASPRLPSPVDTHANRALWAHLDALLTKYKPTVHDLKELPHNGSPGFKPTSKSPLRDRTKLGTIAIERLTAAHKGYADAIRIPVEEGGPQLVYQPGTKGIVSTAGGPYLPIFLVSLRVLRSTGSTLPVELFLADETEYDHQVCDVMLPAMNARCVVLSELLAAHNPGYKTYQYKILAVLFSSFESVLFLDADCFPSVDPAVLFDSEPFTTYGMITWPDYWQRTASPKFYQIAGVPKDQIPHVGVHPATESGQIMFNKSTHSLVILLALYYNIYGPSHYYTLLCQGGAGEGDKETYIAAVHALANPNVTVYTVPHSVEAVGFFEPQDNSHTYHGIGMLQHFPNPAADALVAEARRHPAKDKQDSESLPWPKSGSVFFHQHHPKLNPGKIFLNDPDNPPYGITANSESGKWHRIWSTDATDLNSRLGWDDLSEGKSVDFEHHVWKNAICPVACELGMDVEGDVGITATRAVRNRLTKEKKLGFDKGQACGVCNMFVAEVFGSGWENEVLKEEIMSEEGKEEEEEEKGEGGGEVGKVERL